MAIPPHRTAGESGHIEDHNAIADVLTGHDEDIADTQLDLSAHKNGEDPHGDRAYADQAISDAIGELPDPPVSSVNGYTGSVDLVAGDVGAATPDGVQSLVDQLESDVDDKLATKLDSSVVGEEGGVAPLNGDGFISEEYIPSFTGSNRVVVSENMPEDPRDGDIWVNISDQTLDPSPNMPVVYKTRYEGPHSPPYASLQPGAEWVPVYEMDPIMFTTGPTGYTEISVSFNCTNNATNGSTTHISYALSGDGVEIEAGMPHGVYQTSRGFSTQVGMGLFASQGMDLPANTEITLSPCWRLSSLPAEEDQDAGTGRTFQVGVDTDNSISVKAW